MLGQRLVVGVGIPGASLRFGRELENDHAAVARRLTLQGERCIVVGDELPTVLLKQWEEALLILTINGGFGDVEIHDRVHSYIGHLGAPANYLIGSSGG